MTAAFAAVFGLRSARARHQEELDRIRSSSENTQRRAEYDRIRTACGAALDALIAASEAGYDGFGRAAAHNRAVYAKTMLPLMSEIPSSSSVGDSFQAFCHEARPPDDDEHPSWSSAPLMRRVPLAARAMDVFLGRLRDELEIRGLFHQDSQL